MGGLGGWGGGCLPLPSAHHCTLAPPRRFRLSLAPEMRDPAVVRAHEQMCLTLQCRGGIQLELAVRE